MKKRLKRVVRICTALSVGFVACLRAESVQLPIETLSRTSEMVNYNLTIPEEVAPPVIWRSSNLKNWYFLSHTEVGQNTFSLRIFGQTGFVQGFPRGFDPNNPESTCSVMFYQDLTLGSVGYEVVLLQEFLEQQGFLVLPSDVSKGYFGDLTQSALAFYQASVGISPAVGYFGPITRAYLNTQCWPLYQEGAVVESFDTIVQVREDQRGAVFGFEVEIEAVDRDLYISADPRESLRFSVFGPSGSKFPKDPFDDGSVAITPLHGGATENGFIKIREGFKEFVVIEVYVEPTVSGVYRVSLDALGISEYPGLPDRKVHFYPGLPTTSPAVALVVE